MTNVKLSQLPENQQISAATGTIKLDSCIIGDSAPENGSFLDLTSTNDLSLNKILETNVTSYILNTAVTFSFGSVLGSVSFTANSVTNNQVILGTGDLSNLGFSTESAFLCHQDGSDNLAYAVADNISGTPSIIIATVNSAFPTVGVQITQNPDLFKITTIDGSVNFIQADSTSISSDLGFSTNTANKTFTLKQGANGKTGTVTLNGVTPVTVNNTSITGNSGIIFTLKTAHSPGAYPAIQTITPTTGFTVSGSVGDTSVYNYHIIESAA